MTVRGVADGSRVRTEPVRERRLLVALADPHASLIDIANGSTSGSTRSQSIAELGITLRPISGMRGAAFPAAATRQRGTPLI
ncbi:MAG: hypothetical protein U0570_05860 [Phycisphaerales bacterium]